MEKRIYSWRPQLPDHRDHAFTLTAITLPTKVDLRTKDCPIKDQGEIGSCTSNAIGGLYEYFLLSDKKPYFAVSRLFIYYNERVLENTVKYDAGAELRDGMKVINKFGVCPESEWQYNAAKLTTKPDATCYKDALKHTATSYQVVNQDLISMKTCLAKSHPFVGGFSVYESFESDAVAATGVVPMPTKTEKLLGGHAVKIVGYDDVKKVFIVANSWGTHWGDKGYFYLPYSYLTDPNLASDFWTMQTISN